VLFRSYTSCLYMRTEAEAIESFRVALYDLTFNSKPIITGLTVKAQEMIPCAPSLVQVIEHHFLTVRFSRSHICVGTPTNEAALFVFDRLYSKEFGKPLCGSFC
jgi:hypothetical protein